MKKTTIEEVKRVLIANGFSRKEAREYIKSLRKEEETKKFLFSKEDIEVY